MKPNKGFAGDRGEICDPCCTYDDRTAGICNGRQQKYVRDIRGLVPDVREYVYADGDECHLF